MIQSENLSLKIFPTPCRSPPVPSPNEGGGDIQGNFKYFWLVPKSLDLIWRLRFDICHLGLLKLLPPFQVAHQRPVQPDRRIQQGIIH